MFSIIKRHFHSSYGLRGKRKNVLHSDRVSPRFSPLFVLSLFSFFFFFIARKESHHSFSPTDGQYDVEKEKKR